MSRATVDDILDRIKQLPEEDRLLLDELLAQQEDEEWREEAAKARKIDQERGDAAYQAEAVASLRHLESD